MNPYRGWEIYPQAIYDVAMMMKKDYHNLPWFVSENGMGVADEERFMDDSGMIQDDYRIEFMKEHLSYLHQAIEEGSNCFGYHTWTFIDCWSWLNGYRNRYGFYRVDCWIVSSSNWSVLPIHKARLRRSVSMTNDWRKAPTRSSSVPSPGTRASMRARTAS